MRAASSGFEAERKFSGQDMGIFPSSRQLVGPRSMSLAADSEEEKNKFGPCYGGIVAVFPAFFRNNHPFRKFSSESCEDLSGAELF